MGTGIAMIDRIAVLIMRLKQSLLELGYELPPVMWMHNNKIKQIDMDMKHILQVVFPAINRNQELFANATTLFTGLTAEHCSIRSFVDLATVAQSTCDYISSY